MWHKKNKNLYMHSKRSLDFVVLHRVTHLKRSVLKKYVWRSVTKKKMCVTRRDTKKNLCDTKCRICDVRVTYISICVTYNSFCVTSCHTFVLCHTVSQCFLNMFLYLSYVWCTESQTEFKFFFFLVVKCFLYVSYAWYKVIQTEFNCTNTSQTSKEPLIIGLVCGK